MSSHGPLSESLLAVHVETVVYPDDRLREQGTLWRATAEHDGSPLVALTLLCLGEADDPTGMLADVLGPQAGETLGKVLCFTETAPGDLVVVDMELLNHAPDWALLVAYAVQQSLLVLGGPRAHATGDAPGSDVAQCLTVEEWSGGMTLHRDAAVLAADRVEAALGRGHRGLRVV